MDFQTNKRVCEEVAIIPSKALKNKIAGYATHLMKRIQRGPVRGISLKLQEEERERRMDFVPEVSAVDTDVIEVDPETKAMLRSLELGQLQGIVVVLSSFFVRALVAFLLQLTSPPQPHAVCADDDAPYTFVRDKVRACWPLWPREPYLRACTRARADPGTRGPARRWEEHATTPSLLCGIAVWFSYFKTGRASPRRRFGRFAETETRSASIPKQSGFLVSPPRPNNK